MDLIYYYSDSCGCCKDYSSTVDKLATELKITSQKRNIKDGTAHKLDGVPTIILEDDSGVVYKSVGNLPFEYLISDVRKCLMNNTPKNS